MMTAFNSIPSNFNSNYQQSENLTFSQQRTLIKTEIERPTLNVLELRREVNNLIPYLEKASQEDMTEVFKVFNQVKDNIQISGNDWEENFKDLERKFIEADLINWRNISGARGKISEASKQILKIFDSNLIELNMNDLELNSLPESIGQLSKLQSLYLSWNQSWNQIESLPESFGRLSQLQTLGLDRNRLESLPESFVQLSQLQALDLPRNCLTSLPESFGQLSQLQELNLADNQLESLSESFGLLSQLQILDLPGNRLTSLPASFAQLSQLQELNLSNNQLESIPESLALFSQLQTLDLACNRLASLPEFFGQLSQLQNLNLADNQLESLPLSLAHCRKRIIYLNLEANKNLKKLPSSYEFLYSIKEINVNNTSVKPEEVAILRVKWMAVNRIDAIQLLHIR